MRDLYRSKKNKDKEHLGHNIRIWLQPAVICAETKGESAEKRLDRKKLY